MINHKMLRLSATLLFTGEVVLTYFVQVLHPAGGSTNEDSFAHYAASRNWAAIHLGEFVSTAVFLTGLIILFYAFNLSEGTPRRLGIFAAISAGVALALSGVLYAVDGVALKQAVDAWASAPAAEQAARFASAEAIRWLEWGTNDYWNTMQGLALVLYGIVIVWTGRIPRPVGILMGVSGIAFMALGWLVGTRGFTPAGGLPTQAGWISLYVLTIWMLIVAWGRKAAVQTAAA